MTNMNRNLDRIMAKLRYDKIYNDQLQILDVYSSNLVFSLTLNNYLSPKQHILMEDRPEYVKYIRSYFEKLPDPASTTFEHVQSDPYNWQSYLDLTQLQPGFEKRDHIHSKFLFTGLCHLEGLVMQWMACMGNQNWIQKFGNVRMLLWIPQPTALKIMAPANTRERNKCSIVREAFSDSRVIAMPRNKLCNSFQDDVMDECIIFEEDDFSNPVHPMALVEFQPKDNDIEDMFTWDFITKNMMILKTKPVSESVKNLGPGAEEWFKSSLPADLLKRKVNSLEAHDFKVILDKFEEWPFKPETTIEFISDDRS